MGNGMPVSLMANSLQASSGQQPSTSTGIASVGDDQFARPDLPKDFSLQVRVGFCSHSSMVFDHLEDRNMSYFLPPLLGILC